MRRTPCVGICSTTYGDLVCRGCKRFAHEVTGWNGFSEAQRDTIRMRLQELRDGAVRETLPAMDADALMQLSRERGLDPEQGAASLAYVVLRLALNEADLVRQAGLTLPADLDGDGVLETLQRIDRLFLERSSAYYERAFKTPLSPA
ncbi:MAG: DUF1289 domain-containing protein [Planctomycetota bacterium]